MDVRTIIFCVFLINLFLSLYIYYSMKLVKIYPGVNLWFYSFVFGFFMYLFMGLRNFIPDFLSYFMVNFLMSVVGTLRFIGIRKFFGKNTPKFFSWIPLFYGILMMYFFFIQNSPLIRNIAGAILQVGVVSMIVYLLFKNARDGLKLIFTITGVVFLVYALVVVIRIIWAVFNPSILGIIGNHLLNIILFGSLLATDMAWGTVFFSVNSYRMRGELEASKENQDKMYAYIAHDLRGPLGSLAMTLDRLALSSDISKDISLTKLQQLSGNARNIFQLLENLLLWAKNQAGTLLFTPEILDLNRLVEEVFMAYQNQAQIKNITLSQAIPPRMKIIGDRFMLLAIIQNLIGNGIRYSEHGRTVTIEAHVDEREIRVSVVDQGLGIEKERLDELLSGRKPLPGLGLSICRDFISRHRGRFWAESTLGAGSTFSFSLPIEP